MVERIVSLAGIAAQASDAKMLLASAGRKAQDGMIATVALLAAAVVLSLPGFGLVELSIICTSSLVTLLALLFTMLTLHFSEPLTKRANAVFGERG